MVTQPSNLKTSSSPVFTAIGLGDELLTTYDEGSWTPTVTVGGSAVTMSSQVGFFTRIGNVVHIRGSLAFNRIAVTGDIVFGGLPVASSSNNYTVLAFSGSTGIDQEPAISASVGASTTNIVAERLPSTTSGSLIAMNDTMVAASTLVTARFTGTYFV